MRRLVRAGVCAAALISWAGGAQAQTVSWGIKAGVTSSTLTTTGTAGFDPQTGAGVLAGAWISVGGRIARVQPELLFTTRRFSSPSPGGVIAVSARGIEVPVLLVARLRPDGRVHPLLLAGPYVARISEVTQNVGATTTDLDSQLKDADAGVVLGLGIEIAARAAPWCWKDA